ncbi:alcohol zinc-containing [Moniliophthora roreri MCA 2997]|uniref:Alcohol zinc-containing n=1 Tax=Moniliophthora roreri (strain MCA 2997) TaxID=1381753 RepID=V2XTG7_MONRO|nr:alcohol zinc-containing [Moniliophthora roreri MCA 2997]
MRAFVVSKLDRYSNIPLSYDAPEPQVGPNQVLVEIYSAALNFFETLQTQGKYQNKPPLPFVLGCEFAGRISQNSPIPEGCPFKRGDRVFGAGQGAYADRMSVDVDSLLPLPDTLSYDEGAGLYITWPTSYEGLVGRAEMKPGEWVLVTAAAGGVGISAVQLAKVLGGNVIAAAGSEEKLQVAKQAGADFVVDYNKDGWQQEVLKITNGKGVDVVYDPVGRIQESLKCIRWKGRALVVGFAGGNIEKVPMNLVLLKNISIVGLHWGAYRIHEIGRIDQVWNDILQLFNSKRVKPIVYSKVYSFDRLHDALSALENRETWGKAIVRMREDDSGTRPKL